MSARERPDRERPAGPDTSPPDTSPPDPTPPDTARPDAGQTDAGQAGAGQTGAGQTGAERAGAERAGAERAGAERADAERADAGPAAAAPDPASEPQPVRQPSPRPEPQPGRAAEPASAHVREALAATRADLAALPPLTVPAEVLAGWTAAVGASTSPKPPNVIYIITRRSGGFRRLRPALAAASVLLAVVAAGVLGGPGEQPERVDAVGLAAAGTAAVGTLDVGPLADPGRLAGCLRAAHLPAAAPLGGRRVHYEDRPAVLLVLPTGTLGRLRLVVVDPGCGPDGATVLADRTAGR